MINNYFHTTYNLQNLIDEIHKYQNIQESNEEYIKKNNYSFTQPVIERTPNSFIYNFSYIPTPNFMSVGNSRIDVQSMIMLPDYKDQILSYINKFVKNVNKYTLNIERTQNTISYFQSTKKNVILKTINGEDINKVSRYGLNTIRLSTILKGNVELEFENTEDVFINYFVQISSSYNSSFEFEISFSQMNYLSFNFEGGELSLNGENVFQDNFIDLNGVNKFKFTTGGFGYIDKITVLR